MVSLFGYKLAAVYILFETGIQTSDSMYVIQSDLVLKLLVGDWVYIGIHIG